MMRIRHILRLLFIPLLMLSALRLPASDIPEPVTTYTWEDGYRTCGNIPISASREKIDAVLWNFRDYENWLLDGLTRSDPEAKKLTCTLNSMEYLPDSNIFRIYFSMNIWLLRNREYSIMFTVSPLENSNGIKLEVYKEGKIEKIIDSLVYTISTDYQDSTTTVYYTGNCRLRGIAARFFTLNLYKKNIEWYIRIFARNFMNRLGSQALILFASSD